MRVLQSSPQLLVRVAVDGVQVDPQGAREEDRVLGDDGDPGPELAEAQVGDVDLVYLNGPSGSLHDPETRPGCLIVANGWFF